MPYKNPYNAGVAKQVRSLSQQHVAREKEINDFATQYEIPSQLESAVLHDPAVHGGSGFAAATVADLGFDPTLGATSAEGLPKRRAKKKVIEIGEGLSAAGLSAAGLSAAGVCGGGGVAIGGAKKPRQKKGDGVSGGALLSLRDLDKMHGQPKDDQPRAKITVKAKPQNATIAGQPVASAPVAAAPSGSKAKRHDVVREVMKKHGLSLPAASKYVKEHKLY
jgi:hypothetical protein